MANQTITQLPDAGPITGTELVPIVQNGGTYKTTTAAISASPSQNQTFLTQNQELTLPNSRYLSTNTGLGLTDGGATSFYRISLNGASGSLEAAGAGVIVKNSSTTVVARTLSTSGAGIGVSNGDGTGGDPTFQLTGLAAALANIGGTGMLAVVGGATIAGRQIVGTSGQISVTDGNGSGNPTISIVDNVVLPGTGAATLPIGSNVQQPSGSQGQIRFNSETQTFDGFSSGAWRQFSLAGGVTSFSAGSTGLTPSSATSGGIILGGTLNVSSGGTGSTSLTGYVKGNGTSAMTASASIPNTDVSGLGTMSTQNANSVAITGGTVADATITGGTINNTTIGAGTAAAGTFTSVAMTTGTISTAPVNNTDIVNKEYADAIASGIHFHEAVEYATTTALPAATYNNGTAGVGATLTGNVNGALTVDGYTFTSPADNGKRILVKNQSNGAENGVYTLTQAGNSSPGAPFILTRATDFDTVGTGVDQIDEGDFFLVTSGTANANTAWVQQTPPPIIIGTTAIVFQQFAAPLTYTAGTGLNESPSYTFNIANTGVSAATYGSASQVPVFAVNAQGQITSVTNTSIAIASGAVSGLAASATTDTTDAANITSGTLPTGRISGSYTGITAVGTLTGGTWNANTIGVAYGGTGLTATPSNGQLAIGNGTGYSLATLTAGTNVSITNSSGGITINATPAAGGTVTSVDGSGGTTGLTLSGGPITVSGTLTLGGTLVPANGGTGATTLTGYVYGNGTSTMTASTTIPSTAITGLGTMAAQNANSVAITGGTIDGASVGATTASTVRATTITATGVATFSAGSAADPAITTSGDSNTGIFFPAADTIAFSEGGVEAMRLTAAGDVGIGTNSPTQKLDVSGPIKSSGFFVGSTGTSGFAALGTTGTPTDGGNFVGRSATSTFNAGGVEIYTGGSERMRLNSAGNLGLGVTPSAWGAGIGAMQFREGGLSTWALSGLNGYIYSNAYYDGSTNRYIGTGTACSFGINNNSGAFAWFTAPSGTAGNAITFTQRLSLDVSGNLIASGNVTAYSDERVKTNWRGYASDFLERLAKVKHGTFDRSDIELTQDGVSAQSLQELLPHSVMEDKEGKLSVSYGNAALVAAVKLAERVVALEARLAALEAKG